MKNIARIALAAAFLAALLPMAHAGRIGAAPAAVWQFETLQEDENVFVDIRQLGSVLEITVRNRTQLPPDYSWSMAVCADAQQITSGSRRAGIGPVDLPSLGINSTWCPETGRRGFVLASSDTRFGLNIPFRIELPSALDSFELFAGSGSVRIAGVATGAAMDRSYEQKFVKNSTGGFIVMYSDAGQDFAEYWSSDGGATWSSTVDIFLGTIDNGNLVVNSTDGLYAALNNLDEDAVFAWKAGGTWTTSVIFEAEDAAAGNGIGRLAMAIDSKDAIHMCLSTVEWNGSTANNWLIYTNFTPSQGWWGDGTVTNGSTSAGVVDRSYNGTWLNTNSADDTDGCDIEIDSQDNVYIVESGSDLSDIRIWSNKDSTNTTRGGFGTRFTVLAGTFSNEPAMAINPRTDMLYITGSDTAAETLEVFNQTSGSWNTTWTRTVVVDAATGREPNPQESDIKVSFDGNVFVIYANQTSNPQKIWLANSTVNYTSDLDWTNITVLRHNAASPWTARSYPSMRGSTFPAFNRINTSIEFIYWNQSDTSIYFGNFSVPFDPCKPISGRDWDIDASYNCLISGQEINVSKIFIKGTTGTVTFRHSNVSSTDCRIEPSPGSSISLYIEPTVSWNNAC